MTSPTPIDVLEALEQHTNVLLYGPPGTGKTFLMQEVVKLFSSKYGGVVAGEEIAIDTEEETNPISTIVETTAKVGWVTFHQSYSYEDFVIGLRPDPSSDKLISLVPVPGLLLQLAAFPRQPGYASLLAIDEINRGNVSRIFGEFITLLEVDKRLLENGEVGERTVQVTLPYLKPGEILELDLDGVEIPIVREFTLPRTLFTLASMNSVDKSVAPLDSALRRRFHIIELPADEELLAIEWNVPPPAENLELSDPLQDVNQVRQVGLQVLYKINQAIKAFLGSEYCLGQWYLEPLTSDTLDLIQAKKALADLWESSLYPQLEEMFQGHVEQLIATLDLETDTVGAPVKRIRISDSFADAGGMPYVERRSTSVDSVVDFLRRIGAVASPAPPAEE